MRERLLARLQIGQRGAGILHTGLYTLLAKASGAINLLVAMPFVHGSLSTSEFGAWATLASIAAVTNLLDFGLSNGAMNLVATAHARGDQQEVRAIVYDAWRIIYRMSAALAVIGLVLLACLPWSNLLGLDISMAPQAAAATAVTVFSMVLGVPAGLALRMQLAVGKAANGYRLSATGQVLACITTILLANAGAGLPVLVAAMLWPPVLLSVANTIMFARSLGTSARPANEGTDQRRILAVQREGLMFFVLQLAAVFAYACDLPLIAALAGAEEAGQYAIVQRLFSLVPLALGLLWTPLWPAYRRALARQEYSWAFRTLRRSIVGAILASATMAAAFWYWFGPISSAWMRAQVAPRPELLAGMAAWAIADAVGGAYGTFLNAAGMFRFLLATGCMFSLATLGSKAWLAAHGHVALLPWATLLCFAVFELLPLLVAWPRLGRHVLAKTY